MSTPELLEEIAQVMREKPTFWYKEFEWHASDGGTWTVCDNRHQPVNAALDCRLRRKPRTIKVSGEVPEDIMEWAGDLVGVSHTTELAEVVFARVLLDLIEQSGGE